MAYEQGGGGGRTVSRSDNAQHALSNPLQLQWPPTEEQWAGLQEALDMLFRTGEFNYEDLRTVEESVSEGGSGDVVGPSSATDGRIAEFDGTTGKLLADSGKLTADVVTGPSSATGDNIAIYNGATGKIIKDSGFSVAGITSQLLVATKELSVAELQSLNSTPIEAIAGVANKIIVPFRWTMQQQMGITTWSAAPIVTPVYAGGTVATCASITITNTASVTKTVTEIASVSTGTNNFSYSGVGINLRGAADRRVGPEPTSIGLPTT